jgi:ankyrin repeat protein
MGVRDENSQTLLHYAARGGNSAVARLLLKRLAASGASEEKIAAAVEARDRWARTALHWGALNGHAGVLEVLLLEGGARANPAVPPRKKRQKRTHARYETPLHAAARKGHGECVALLIEAGAQLDAVNDDGDLAGDVAHSGLRHSARLPRRQSSVQGG